MSLQKTALCSMILNVLFGAYYCVIGVQGASWWFVTLGAYQLVLCSLRFGVLFSARRGQDSRRLTGILLIALAVTLAGTTYLSVERERGIAHHTIVMITIATYAFTRTTLSVIQLIHAKKTDAATVKALRTIAFADALVSIFSLQRSMLVSFPGASAPRLMNALTGTGVSLIIIICGINLIGGKYITMAKEKIIKANEKIASVVKDGYQKIEHGVVSGYKTIETGVVDGYTKMEDRFIDTFLKRDGETIEEARRRLKQ